MKFIIETDVNATCEQLAEVAREGHEVVRWSPGDPIPATGDIFFGSLNVYDTKMPGLRGNPQSLSVLAWEHVKGLLNTQTVRATVEDLPKSFPWPGEKVFVRPNSPLKPFSGRVLNLDELNPAALDFGFYYDNPKTMVLFSPVQEIKAEWRFVGIGDEVVASSGYGADRQRRDSIPPPDAVYLAMRALRQFRESDVVIDICQLATGQFRIVEFNLLSGADLYGCNVQDIVDALARQHTNKAV